MYSCTAMHYMQSVLLNYFSLSSSFTQTQLADLGYNECINKAPAKIDIFVVRSALDKLLPELLKCVANVNI